MPVLLIRKCWQSLTLILIALGRYNTILCLRVFSQVLLPESLCPRVSVQELVFFALIQMNVVWDGHWHDSRATPPTTISPPVAVCRSSLWWNSTNALAETELKDAAWYYPETLEKANHIKNYVAFCMLLTVWIYGLLTPSQIKHWSMWSLNRSLWTTAWHISNCFCHCWTEIILLLLFVPNHFDV